MLLSLLLATALQDPVPAANAPTRPPLARDDEGTADAVPLPTVIRRSFEELDQGMSGLDPVTQALRQYSETIDPLARNYQDDPSLENKARLERVLAQLTADLSRKMQQALVNRERVVFAFQDILRSVRSMGTSVESEAESQARLLRTWTEELEATSEEMEEVVTAYLVADEEEQALLEQRFRELERVYARHEYKIGILQGTINNHRTLGDAVALLTTSLGGVQDRVVDVFDRVEDASELLAFAANFRQRSVDLERRYRELFGEGEESVRGVLERLQTIEGKLELFNRTNDILNRTGPISPILADLSSLTTGLAGGEVSQAGSIRDRILAFGEREGIVPPRVDEGTDSETELPPAPTPAGGDNQ